MNLPKFFSRSHGFKYEVNWESDGKVFDFASYAKRVPKEVREKTGKFVAVEGFMIQL